MRTYPTEVEELRRRIVAVLVYLAARHHRRPDAEHVRQLLTRPAEGVGKRLS